MGVKIDGALGRVYNGAAVRVKDLATVTISLQLPQPGISDRI